MIINVDGGGKTLAAGEINIGFVISRHALYWYPCIIYSTDYVWEMCNLIEDILNSPQFISCGRKINVIKLST